MGWQDRDYSQYLDDGPSVFSAASIRRSRVSQVLLIVHIAAAVMLLSLTLAGTDLTPVVLAITAPSPGWWTILTHPFASVDFFRVLLTGLILWSLAPRIEELFGKARLIQSYLLGNFAAGAVFWGVARWRPAWASQPLDYPVGAGIAWLVLYWQIARHEMTVIAGKPMRVGIVIAVIGGVLIVLSLAIGGIGAIGWLIAAVVGGVVGICQPLKLNIRLPQRRLPPIKRPRPAVLERREERHPPQRKSSDDIELDEILKKISRDGMGSLTDEDRAKLETARQLKLRKTVEE